jgi:tRNA threonylcarbamoyladenosine biosynthesis protein TsaE
VRQSAAKTLIIPSADRTREVGSALGSALLEEGAGACVVAIEGELGAGKTTLVSGVLGRLGITGAVRSPTYTLIEPYEASGRQIYHLDLYRLSSAEEVEALGVRDLLVPRSLLLVEWPSRAGGALPLADLEVRLAYSPEGAGRLFTLAAHSSLGDRVLQRFVAEIAE